MKNFEIVGIFPAPSDDGEIDEAIESLASIVVSQGGRVDVFEDWGQRTFAYKIAGHRKGRYIFLQVLSTDDALATAVKYLEENSNLIRIMIVPIPESQATTEIDTALDGPFDHINVSIWYERENISNPTELEAAARSFMSSLGYRVIPYSSTVSLDSDQRSGAIEAQLDSLLSDRKKASEG